MSYRRIFEARELPAPGASDAREKSDLDFKSFADERQPWEHAKDIAAFANALGGVLLVGADDNGGQLVYRGIQGQSVPDVKRIYEGAAQLCSPTPVVNVVPVEHAPGVVVVAVNVDPYVDQAVAAPASTRDQTGRLCKHDTAWGFPIRRASQTDWIKPEALPMYMNREIRRAVLLLARVPTRTKVKVHFHKPRDIDGRHWDGIVQIGSTALEIDDVSVELNRVRFVERRGSENFFGVPLLDVLDVWESAKDQWEVLLAGVVRRTNGQQYEGLYYEPMPRRAV